MMGRVVGAASAKSKISFGGSPSTRDELEKRLVIMQCNLNHDSWTYATGLDGTTRAGEQDIRIELRQKNLKEQTMVTTVRGPTGRWYVKNVNLTKLGPFCR